MRRATVVTVDQARAEAVSARRLARIYETEARLCGCGHLTAAAALAYQRAEDLEHDAKEMAA